MIGEDIDVAHDELTFRCRLDGRQGAPWIVFSNSLLTDLSVWDAQVSVLRDRYRILRYDQRGHGKTGVPPGPCNFDQLGGDAAALIDRFEVSACVYVGLSMGVTTGLQLVSRHGERVKKLVFADGQSVTAPGGRQAWEDRIADARRLGMPELARMTLERWFSPAFREAGKHLHALEVAATTPLEGYVACARALQAYDFSAVPAQITVPTLLIAGANDGNMPVSMRSMSDSISGSVMQIIAEAGHLPNYEQPAIFNRHLLDFLR